jgi:hypothetical protein
MLAVVLLGVSLAVSRGAEPAPDFKLSNHNPRTAHGTNLVSPRDYLFQISAYYFASSECSFCRTQLGYLNDLRNELRGSNLPVNIEIMGVNQIGAEETFYNTVVTAGRTMPWLQDTPEAGAWTKWGVEYRDVRILDSSNRLAAVFNLTAKPLTEPANKAELKALLLGLANAYDSDGDRLPDHWEWAYLKTLAYGANDDPDADRANNMIELLLGSNPLDRASHPQARTWINDASRFTLVFNRWGGKLGNYTLGSSLDLKTWGGDSVLILSERNLVDGTGRFEVSASFDASVVNQPLGFLTLGCSPKP